MTSALIYNFGPLHEPFFDDEGDQMMDYYYQLLDDEDEPLTDMRGPYRYSQDAERAARQAVRTRDF